MRPLGNSLPMFALGHSSLDINSH